MATNREEELVYGSQTLLDGMRSILANHRAVGDQYPGARPALIENLRALHTALPGVIAEVEAAAAVECDECRQVKPDVKETTIAGQAIRLCDACLPKLRAMSPFDTYA